MSGFPGDGNSVAIAHASVQPVCGGIPNPRPSTNSPMNAPADSLCDAMRRAGVNPIPELIADAVVRRFASPTDKHGRKSGWCILFPSGVGIFGSWKGDIEEQVIAPAGSSGRPSKAVREEIERAKERAGAERARLRAEAAERARKLWDSAQPADPQHPYLVHKAILPHGIRQRGRALCVPMRDIRTEQIVNLQFIDAAGSKRFLSHGQVTGTYFPFPINDLGEAQASQLCIGEGFATVATIHEGTGLPAAAAFNCGNLLAVANALHEKRPDAQIVIAADDDHETPGNPGLTKGAEAARAVDGLIAIPKFKDGSGRTDFNDMAAEQGLDAVRRQIAEATSADGRLAVTENIPPGFRLTKDRLYILREAMVKKERKFVEHPVCSRLEVVALTRNGDSGDWGRLLRFKDADGREHEWAMPMEMLSGDGGEYRARLLEQGLNIWPELVARHGLHEYLHNAHPPLALGLLPASVGILMVSLFYRMRRSEMRAENEFSTKTSCLSVTSSMSAAPSKTGHVV